MTVLQDYGLTEAMPVVTITPLDDARTGCVATAGRPVPHCRVRIAEPPTAHRLPTVRSARC